VPRLTGRLVLATLLLAGASARGQEPSTPRLTRPPALRGALTPAYPTQALAARRSGDVTLEVDLDAEGRVTGATVAAPAGDGFDEAALAAIQRAEFTPAEVDGLPAPIRFTYVVRFRPPPLEPRPAAPGRVVARGLIRERGTRAPIAGAQVILAPRAAAGDLAPASTVAGETDAEGRFDLRVPAGMSWAAGLRVTVADPAHEPCLREFEPMELVWDTPPLWTCFAGPLRGPGYETIVSAPPAAPEQARHVLAPDEARSVPGTMGDPLRAVQSLPGVARPPYGMGLLVVRGASPADSGVFLDGLALPALYHFLVGPSVVPAQLVGRIDFFPGGFGVRYGRITAGAIDVTTREPPLSRQIHGAVEISPLDGSLLVETPVGARTSITVGARRSALDFILPAVVPERPGSTFATAVPAYWDYQARIDHLPARGGRLSFFAFGSDDDLDVVSADPNRRIELGTHVRFHRAMLTWTTSLGAWRSRLQPAYGYGDDGFAGARDRGNIRNHRLYLREELSRDFGPRSGLALGFDGVFSYDWASFDFSFPREGRTFGSATPERVVARRSFVDIAPALWMEARLAPVPALRIVPGVRADSYFVVGTRRHSFDPRLLVRWELLPGLALRGGVGLYHQLPTPRYLDEEFGNPGLALTRARQVQLGIDQDLGDQLQVSATLFSLARSGIPVASPERFASTGRARSRGIELLMRRPLTQHFYGWIAYTLARAEQSAEFADEIESGLASPRGAAQDEGARVRWRPATFDQTHNLVVVGSYRRRGWELGLRYRFVSGRPTTPVAGSFVDLDFGAHSPERGPAYSSRQAAFSQLDLRVERTFTLRLFRLGVFLDVQNVSNAVNAEDVVYDYRYRDSAPVRGLPILPLLGMRGTF
jgi:TonB family protein